MKGKDAAGIDERRQMRVALMVRAQRGDREAYRVLLADISRVLPTFLRRRGLDPADVADVVQDTLINVHRARHTYDPARPFEPWLLAIARNAATDHLRRRRARLAREVTVDELPDVPVAADDGATAAALEGALASLPPAQRQAFELLKVDGMSAEAAADKLGITSGALRVRAHRAYQRLRERLGGTRG